MRSLPTCVRDVGMSSRVFARQLVDDATFVSGLFGPCCCVVSADTTGCRFRVQSGPSG